MPIALREGDSENAEVVRDLLSSLRERGFKLHCDKLLVILDGSKALKKALRTFFGERVLIQRCWPHKARNICAYLPKTYHGQVNWRMKRLMNLKSFAEAKQEYESFHRWLSELSEAAGESLDEAGDDLITLHALGVSGDLRKSLSTMNSLESLFSVVCTGIGRNKRYRLRSQQKMRWIATAVLEHHRTKMRCVRSVAQRNILSATLGQKVDLKVA